MSGKKSKGKEAATLPVLASIVEAILFAVDRPVTVAEILVAIPEADKVSIQGAIDELEERFSGEEFGVSLQEVAGGYQLSTKGEMAGYVERFLVGRRRTRLSRAALETLATISYRQPVTRGEIEDLRGVDSGHVLHTLIDRDLITVKGRSETLGRPLLYGTTPEFLSYFGLRSLSDLPNIEEFEALSTDNPLEDPEIRDALEATGLLEGLAEDGLDLLGPSGEGPHLDPAVADVMSNGLGSPEALEILEPNGDTSGIDATENKGVHETPPRNGTAEDVADVDAELDIKEADPTASGHENGHGSNGHAQNGGSNGHHAQNGSAEGEFAQNGNSSGSGESHDPVAESGPGPELNELEEDEDERPRETLKSDPV